MTDYIGDELPPKIIRVTKGCDRKFTVIRKDAVGAPVDWDAEVFLNIDLTTPSLIEATVTGPNAVVFIGSAVADQVKNSTLWQLYMSTPEAPASYENPLAVGYFQRQDGKATS